MTDQTTSKHFVAEPDPSFVVEGEPLWRLRAATFSRRDYVTIGQGMTEEEARACERALSALPGNAQVDEVARRRLEATSVFVVGGAPGEVEVSSAPFVPWSAEDVAETAEVARWLLEKKLAPSARMAEPFARALLTLARTTLSAEDLHHLRVVRAAIGGELATDTGRVRWSGEAASLAALTRICAGPT